MASSPAGVKGWSSPDGGIWIPNGTSFAFDGFGGDGVVGGEIDGEGLVSSVYTLKARSVPGLLTVEGDELLDSSDSSGGGSRLESGLASNCC